MTALKEYIDAYFTFRGYKTPGPMESLLFFLSEVGELAEAYKFEHRSHKIGVLERVVLNQAVFTGRLADQIVSGRKSWVRNYDRKKKPSMKFEIGDCQMMLERFADAELWADPVGCMLEKMRSKGYDVLLDLEKEEYCEAHYEIVPQASSESQP
jgi:NTP pyrophosphatase (non-canonical NTP hydrolase)